MTKSLLLAGFGGQGILFAAKQIAALGMDLGKNVTWLPSYGPESRGGTSNCSVIISDEEIGSPIVNRPDCLVVFNLPSFDKFIGAVAPGGEVFVDSTLVSRECERDDIKAYYIPATGLAAENGIEGSANVIMLGKIIAETGLFGRDEFLAHMSAGIPSSRAHLIERNNKAFDIGYYYNK